ncbi:hypothetical protein RB614_28790 [Phytohabitans sp. ZYX-F-186]|uniref:Uncharacterized protein n=1 Tax=Phytohabitans maris TaxID=3071409 RepID=A0ABU0ZNB5_9ACTN|nr:hypothetical protein [Phytohabitans sp. ZYX-F-186]MDQ7908534.1 hypothetical protein [Phytohabitans sp. ZYX-F-186]
MRFRPVVAALATTLALSTVVLVAPGSAAAAGPLADLVLVETDTATTFGAVSLVTATTDGTPSTKNPVPLPATAQANHHPLTLDAGEPNAGHLNRSADGRYLTVAGWNREPGTGSDPGNHSVARVDARGGIDTTTTLGDSFNREFPNSVVSPDGQTFFASGQGKDSQDNSAIVRVRLGGNDPEAWTSSLMRTGTTARILDGDLYVATTWVSPYGIAKVGDGIPAAPAPYTAVFGSEIPGYFGSGMGDFTLLDVNPDVPGLDTAYVTDGGIMKLSFDGTRWTGQGQTRQLGDIDSFTARVVDGKAELFVVRGSGAGNQLVRVVDNAASGALPVYEEQVLKTAEGTRTFRGVDFAPDGWNPKPARPAPSTEVAVVEVNGASTANQSASVAIQRYATGNNAYRGQIQLPGTAGESGPAFTLPSNNNTAGGLRRSADGRYVTLAGNGNPVGPKAAAPTVVVRIDGQAQVANTVLPDAYAAASGVPYEVVTADGSAYWTSGTATSLRYAPHGASTSTQVEGFAPTSMAIVDGVLYAGGNQFGGSTAVYRYDSGLPTAADTRTAVVPNITYQNDFALLDADDEVAGPDLLYFSNPQGTLAKYALVDGAWTSVGSFPAGTAYAHLAAQTVLGGVELYATPADGSRLVKLVDTADRTAAPAIAAPVTMATATPGTVLRGVSFPPVGGWPAASGQPSARPSILASSTQVVGTALNPRNPTLGISLNDRDTPATQLTLTVTSSNQAVLPDAGITVDGTGAYRRLFFAPLVAGGSQLTIRVSDPQGNTTTTTATYTAEPAVADTSIFFYYGVDDVSSAVDVGDGYLLGVTDEENAPRLWKRQKPADVTGPGSAYRTIDIPGIGGGEYDYEGLAKVGDLIYLFASHGNDKGGGSEPERARFDVVRVTGTGANIQLTRVGGTETLKAQLLAWDAGNGHGLGADALGFVAGSRVGVIPNPPDGFNIEGVEAGPSSTSTLYLAFRAPTYVKNGKPHAVIVPVTNIDTYMTGEDAQAEFGAPIFLDLGGRSIRDIRKNADDDYVISAGPGNGNTSWALYTWNGRPNSKPVLDQLLPDENVDGTWETVPSVPSPMVAGAQIELLTDAGDADGRGRSFGKMFTLTGGPRPGHLVVYTQPAGAGATVTVDGVARDTGGLDGLALPDGQHRVCVQAPSGYTAPACQNVTISQTAGATLDMALTPTSGISARWNSGTIGNAPVTVTVDGVPVNDGTTGTVNARVAPGQRVICWSAVAGFNPPACQTRTFDPGVTYAVTGSYTANPDASAYSGPTGMLRVAQTANPVATTVVVDGKPRATWGLDWMRIAPGQHEVCFTDVPGYITPACRTVTVTGALTTTVEVAFTPAAVLQVSTDAPGPAQIFVNGVAYDGWGVWTYLPAGEVQVSFGAVPGRTTPPSQTVTLTPGQTTVVTGSYPPAS